MFENTMKKHYKMRKIGQKNGARIIFCSAAVNKTSELI